MAGATARMISGDISCDTPTAGCPDRADSRAMYSTTLSSARSVTAGKISSKNSSGSAWRPRSGSACGIVPHAEVEKPHELFLKEKVDLTRGAVPVLGHDDIGHMRPFGLGVVHLIAVDKEDDVRILLYRATFSEIREHGLVIWPLLRCTREL